MTQVMVFLNDPLVAPLWALAILSLCVFALTVWRSIEATPSQFDVNKLPRLLDTLVLRKMVPLAVLGVAHFTVTDQVTKDMLLAAYAAGLLAAAAAETRQLIDAVTGGAAPDLPMSDVPHV